MFKPAYWPVYWVAASLALAGLCALPALAQDAGKPDMKAHPMRPSFSDIDANKDGVISQAEFDAFRPKPPEGGWHGHDRRGHDHHSRHRHGHHGRPEWRGRFHGFDLKSLDTNADGKISFEEFSAPMKKRFDRLDANHDRVLDETELKARHEGNGPPPPEKK